MTDDRDIEALVCAAREGRLSDVQRMLREVADLKIDDYAGSSHTSAIDAATQFNRVQVVRWLSQQYSSFGPMMLCKAYRALATDSTSDREAMVRMLHEHRAPQGSCYEPFQDPEVLNEAATSGMDDVVKLMIKRGADINAEEDKTKLTPLIAAKNPLCAFCSMLVLRLKRAHRPKSLICLKSILHSSLQPAIALN